MVNKACKAPIEGWGGLESERSKPLTYISYISYENSFLITIEFDLSENFKYSNKSKWLKRVYLL